MIEIRRSRQPVEGVQLTNGERPTEGAQKAAEGLDAQAMGLHAPSAEPALKREIRPFTGIDEKRDYRAMYRAAFEYHDRHRPAQIDGEYWRTHTPGIDDMPQVEADYWAQAALDISEVSNSFNNDSFIMALLAAIYTELGREYTEARRLAAEQPFIG